MFSNVTVVTYVTLNGVHCRERCAGTVGNGEIFAARQEALPKSVAASAISSVSGVTISGGAWLGLVGHRAALGKFSGPKLWERFAFVVFLF